MFSTCVAILAAHLTGESHLATMAGSSTDLALSCPSSASGTPISAPVSSASAVPSTPIALLSGFNTSPSKLSSASVVTCDACGEPGVVTDTELRGKQRWHMDCVSSYKGQARKWSTCPSLKKLWSQRSPEDKAAWFRDQRHRRLRGQKRTYEEAELQESNYQNEESQELDMEDYLPWEEFYIRGRQLDKSAETIQEEWDEAILDDDRDKKWRHGRWCVYVFRGVAGRRGTIKGSGFSEIQRARNPTTESLDALRDLAPFSSALSVLCVRTQQARTLCVITCLPGLGCGAPPLLGSRGQ